MDSFQLPPATPEIRAGRDEDSWDLIGLVASCFAEYPGCVLDVHGEMPYLLAPASSYAEWGGRFWVGEVGGRLVGSVGMVPAGDTVALRTLYVARTARRRGLGGRLIGTVEQAALELGARAVELWSDTRFTDAHRLYQRKGYVRRPETRELHDRSRTVEYGFGKQIGGHGGRSTKAAPSA